MFFARAKDARKASHHRGGGLSKKVCSPLGPLCEGAPPAGGGGENCTAARNISGYGKVLSLRPFGAPPSQREVFRHAGLPSQGRWPRSRPEGLLRFAAAVGRGGVKTPPYDAKDKRAVPARWRAGHARPLRTAVPGQSFHPAERGTINRTPKRPKNRLVRHCGQNAHNSSKNMCNFLNKTPLRKGGFLVQ